MIAGHLYALAAHEPIVFHHVIFFQLFQKIGHTFQGIKGLILGISRDIIFPQQVSGKGFGCFQLGKVFLGADGFYAGFPQGIGNTVLKRIFRSDDGQRCGDLLGIVHHKVRIINAANCQFITEICNPRVHIGCKTVDCFFLS